MYMYDVSCMPLRCRFNLDICILLGDGANQLSDQWILLQKLVLLNLDLLIELEELIQSQFHQEQRFKISNGQKLGLGF